MGARTILVWMAGSIAMILASDLPPVAHVPQELRLLFQPEELSDDALDHPGTVERGRRASGSEDPNTAGYTYTLYSLGGAPCILAQTESVFYIDYRTRRQGVKTAKVVLPREPEISGSCVREGDTAVLTMRWSVFNFSLIFTENPEGNSYYLNRALLKFNQSIDLFKDSTYHKQVVLETQRGWNYYFTPLGKSYTCEHGEDQGPLRLYNEDDEVAGNMTLFNTRFQPFVKRAKGDWGPQDHCLPKSIQVMREDVVPYVVSCVFLVTVVGLVSGYGLYRKFNVSKTDYGFYGEEGAPDGSGGGEAMMMEEGANGSAAKDPMMMEEEEEDVDMDTSMTVRGRAGVFSNGNGQQQRQKATPAAPAAAVPTPAAAATASNPFKATAAKNPFKQ